MTQRFTCGCTPDAVIKAAALEQCPSGYHMTLNERDWEALAAAWNQGIDSHLEGMARSYADASSGQVVVHPEELHILIRRLNELDAEKMWPDWNLGQHNYPNESLRQDILSTLGIEEI
jgi:hypothetical protein